VPPPRSSEEGLLHALDWRTKLLIQSSGSIQRPGDGPALARSLARSGTDAIRQPPLAAQRALLVARDHNAAIRDLVALFKTDPTLAPPLLKSANSIWYRRDGEVLLSIGEAVQRIGMRGVENVLVTQMVRGMLCRPGGAYDRMVEQVWLHMLRTAPLARRLSPAFGVDPEIAYTLGLLHDVGKLVILDNIAGLRQSLRRDVRMPEPFLASLMKQLHEPLGGLAALRWGVGETAAAAISEHHRHAPAPDPVSELIFTAECLDLIEIRRQPLDWDALWIAGSITADRAAVERAYAEGADEDEGDPVNGDADPESGRLAA
jgi:HD-like signal output (HDOD) protein